MARSRKRVFKRKLRVNLRRKVACKSQRQCRLKWQEDKRLKITRKAEFCERFIKNLSNRQLTPYDKIVLGKGLKFIPTPIKPDRITLLRSFCDLSRKMRMRYFMFNKNKNELRHKFKMPSAWVPQPAPCNELENYLEATKELIAATPFKNKQFIAKSYIL